MTWNASPRAETRPPRQARAFAREIGLRIAHYRHTHGLSIEDLARATGIRRHLIILLESGQVSPSLTTLARITAVTALEFHLDIRAGTVVLTG